MTTTSDENFTRSFCPECGWDVKVDEDGCCITCGATATGEAVEKLAKQVDRKRERILCAAIHFQTGEFHEHRPTNLATGLVVCGMRHHNCFMNSRYMLVSGKPIALNPSTQGFLTSYDRFVDRKEAARIAFEAGQIDHPLTNEEGKQTILTSEDLY
jgi:hypothetical protein